MGINSSKEEKLDQSQLIHYLPDEPEQLKNYLNQHFKEIQVSPYNSEIHQNIQAYQLKINQKRQIAIIKHQNNNQRSFETYQNELQKQLSLRHETLTSLYKFMAKENENFCSSFYEFLIVKEYIHLNLQQEFQERQKQGVSYEECELWHIIVSVIAGIAYLKQNYLFYGNLSPKSIFITDQGVVKIQPRNFFTQEITPYQQFITNDRFFKSGHYISPQQYYSYHDQQQKTLITSYFSQNQNQNINSKSDVYALGLVIIELINGQNIPELQDIYDKLPQLQQKISNLLENKVKNNYSQFFYNFLKQLLKNDEEKRPDVEELFEKLEKISSENIQVSDRLFFLEFYKQTKSQQSQNSNINSNQNNLSIENIQQSNPNSENRKSADQLQYSQCIKNTL
ncbi:Protein kinase-like domain [Pseudocohnilembus persalinus]|uniref:Protein kinase-like domain n=1 Tax=Pseudocohnilembus persalinus TaxID=266149 RepID=A0A0V0QWE5_PSEPJ|nr:Protein kinase-like domain [Pseudocohnilembus persalinus]|eukprot:KRX06546.1 Protein kinase-like domain [Pseudocohnilembus persalinus]